MILKTIQQRRSIFPAQYSKEPVRNEQIEQLFEAANWAPTHRKTEPWRFYVVTGDRLENLGDFLAKTYRTTTDKFSEFKFEKIKAKPQQASHVIVICMERDPKERVPEWEEIAATAMAVQNMWLMATELKLGSYWSSPSLVEHMEKFLPMKENEKCLGLFYVGNYDDESPRGVRQPIENKVTWL
ncbi:nitroreductase [Mesonia ostreae]|uniref:Putative NAD(P)H nitroreductase n=1 Tax=Mesonia ostreae TaxID=861110 RepID=A0ABU2KMC3_9FLAO|nr:nitroreductase [Mesonia ostreae]MDT0295858.1 nitroreductase [Mesonia ostreae]